MSDLFFGQTCTAMYKYVTVASAAHTFTFPFQPDQVDVVNITKWTATAQNRPIARWYRDSAVLTAGKALLEEVIDSSAGASFNFTLLGANGFTVADTEGGQSTSIANITGAALEDPLKLTHSTFTFQNDQIVRITDLGQVTNTVNRGLSQINNKRYKIKVVDATHIRLYDVITGEPIDGTGFTAWVAGGKITLETHVIALNNPQVDPYNVTPYVPNQFKYDPIEYKLTVGTGILAAASEFRIVAIKYGTWEDLGVV